MSRHQSCDEIKLEMCSGIASVTAEMTSIGGCIPADKAAAVYDATVQASSQATQDMIAKITQMCDPKRAIYKTANRTANPSFEDYMVSHALGGLLIL